MSNSEGPPLYRRIAARLVRWAGAVLGPLPLRAKLGLGRGLGSAIYYLVPRPARTTRENIRIGLDVDSRSATRLARATYRHFGRAFMETLFLTDYLQPELAERFDTEGFEHLLEARSSGRGVIVFTAHIGNWELLGARLAAAGFPVHAVAKPLSNPDLDHWLTMQREAAGNQVLGYKSVLRRAIGCLKEGGTLFILPDQYVRSGPRVMLPFFGRTTAVTPFLARLALKMEPALIPAYSVPKPDGGYVLRFEAPLAIPESGSLDDRTVELMARVTRRIESWVREHPDCWLWLHDRWKTTESDTLAPIVGTLDDSLDETFSREGDEP